MSGNSENSFGSYRPMWPTQPLKPLIRPSVQPLRPALQPAVNRPLQPLQTLQHPRIPPPPYPAPPNQLINQRAPLRTVQSGPDLNKQLSDCLEQIKELQDKQKQMKHDNQELRDLCCFLDDDRQRARKLAKEWQKFGRYTAKVMRQEVSFVNLFSFLYKRNL